jgi:transcription elongation factor SPT5
LHHPHPQQARQPSLRDPKLFMVKCNPGKEKDVLLALMQRFANREKRASADRLLITSAFSNLMIPGVIYVEAHKDTHVKAAVDGIQVRRIGIEKR